MSGTEHDLDPLVEQAERLHLNQYAQTSAELEVLHSPSSERSRQDFLKKMGLGGLAFTGLAFATMPSLAFGAPSKADAETVKTAIRVELFAVGAYMTAAQNASKLGLTSAQVNAGKLFASHHAAHAKAEQDFLKSLKIKAPTTGLKTDEELKAIGLSNAAIKKAFSTGTGALTAALYVEEVAAKTYSDFAFKTKDRTVADFAWSIAPVELGHAGYLRAALGLAPVDANFSGEVKPIKI